MVAKLELTISDTEIILTGIFSGKLGRNFELIVTLAPGSKADYTLIQNGLTTEQGRIGDKDGN